MDHFQRYHRQMLLPFIGADGQHRLADAAALVVGCGALGSVVVELLTRAGVGRLRIVDRDVVEPTNLHRQGLFDEADAAAHLPKVEAASNKLAAVNSAVRLEPMAMDVNPSNAWALADGMAAIIDATDNFETRFLINDVAVRGGVPLIYGGAIGDQAMQMNVLPATPSGDAPWQRAEGATPCLRCVFGAAPAPGSQPTCDTAGVLGPLAWFVAAAQAIEAIKVLVGDWAAVDRRLRHWAGWTNDYTAINLSTGRDDDCPCCAHRRFAYLDGQAASQSTAICGRQAVQVMPAGTSTDDQAPAPSANRVDFHALAGRLGEQGPVTRTAFSLRAELRHQGQTYGLTLFADGRAIILGTRDPAVARSLYSRYIGL